MSNIRHNSIKIEPTSILMSVYYMENPVNFDLAIQSILVHQTHQPEEFVLVCDGPLNEDLDAVISKYEKEYPDIFKVYRTEKNQGLGKALNYGMTKCSYDLVARADSDDVCKKNRIEKQASFMAEHPEISIVSSYIYEFDDDWTKPDKRKQMPLTHDRLVKMAKFRNPINHMAVMFRKKDIMEIGSYHHVPYVEDYDLWVRAIVNGKKLANIDDYLVHARVGNGMVGRRGNREYVSSWRKLSSYMLKYRMINRLEYLRNMIAIRLFVHMPRVTKEKAYKILLRI